MWRLYTTAMVVLAVGAGAATATDPAKVKGDRAGGIEIGFRGCRMAVVQVDRTPWEAQRVRVRRYSG